MLLAMWCCWVFSCYMIVQFCGIVPCVKWVSALRLFVVVVDVAAGA